MTLSDLASLGSFISGMAVVFSFIFLALQMRQSNLNQRALMQQGRSAGTADIQLKASEPYLSEAMNRGFSNDLTMDDTQIRSFLMICVASVTNWENSFFQHRAGVLDESSFASDIAILRVFASAPAFRAMWPTVRDWYGKDFRTYVDGVIRETQALRAPPSVASAWKERLAQELEAAI